MSKLLKGLKTRMPAAPSATPKGASVDSGATRGSTAKTPKSLGPREA